MSLQLVMACCGYACRPLQGRHADFHFAKHVVCCAPAILCCRRTRSAHRHEGALYALRPVIAAPRLKPTAVLSQTHRCFVSSPPLPCLRCGAGTRASSPAAACASSSLTPCCERSRLSCCRHGSCAPSG